MDTIKSNWSYWRIARAKLFRGLIIMIVPNLLFALFVFIMKDYSFVYFGIEINVVLFLLVFQSFLGKANRVLYSICFIEEHMFIEYFYFFIIKRKTILREDVEVKYYQIELKGIDNLVLEIRCKNVLLLEILEGDDYGWDSLRRKELIDFLRPHIKRVRDNSSLLNNK